MVAVGLAAGLGREGEGDGVAVGLAEDGLDLVDGVGAVLELGHVEAPLLDDVLADDLGDRDLLGHAVLDGLGHGDLDVDGQGLGDEGDAVGLGLVFLAAVLVLTGAIVIAVARGPACGDLHRLSLGLVGDLTSNKVVIKGHYRFMVIGYIPG